MPITFVVALRASKFERGLIGCLMAMGLVTATAAMVKTAYISNMNNSGDTLWDQYYLTLWSKIEEVVGITAASAPCLKSWAQHVLSLFLSKAEPSEPPGPPLQLGFPLESPARAVCRGDVPTMISQYSAISSKALDSSSVSRTHYGSRNIDERALVKDPVEVCGEERSLCSCGTEIF